MLEESNEFLAPTDVRLDRDFGADHDLLVSLIPDKMAFKIGEVSEMLGLKNYILRYWESEFQELKPKKSRNNQRMYTQREIEILIVVRKFLYVDKFSVSGARKALRDWKKDKKGQSSSGILNKKDLMSLLDELNDLSAEIKKLSIL